MQLEKLAHHNEKPLRHKREVYTPQLEKIPHTAAKTPHSQKSKQNKTLKMILKYKKINKVYVLTRSTWVRKATHRTVRNQLFPDNRNCGRNKAWATHIK